MISLHKTEDYIYIQSCPVYYIKFMIKHDSLLTLEWYILDLDYILVFTKCGGGRRRRWLFIFADDKKEGTASAKIGPRGRVSKEDARLGGKVQREEIRLTLVSHVF
jgi:hypothetical protein